MTETTKTHPYLRWLAGAAALLLASALTPSCNSDEARFDMTYQRQFEIQAGLAPFTAHVIKIEDIPTDTAAFFGANNVTSDRILKINPLQCRLFSQFNDTNFGFVELAAVIIVNPLDPDDRQEVFYRDNIPLTEDDVLDIFPDLPNVKEMLTRLPKYDLELVMRFREPVPSTLSVRLDWAFRAAI